MSEMDIPIHIAMALPISLKVPYTLDSQGNFFIFLECGSSACEITESKVPKLFDDLLCEHYQFTLSCEENESLKIHSAFYGRQHIPNNCASTRNGSKSLLECFNFHLLPMKKNPNIAILRLYHELELKK